MSIQVNTSELEDDGRIVVDGLSIEFKPAGDDRCTLALVGEIDLATAETLEHGILRAESLNCRVIVLDLAGLEFIDSRGLRVLMSAQQRAERAGWALLLANVPGPVRRLFEIVGLDSRFVLV